MEENSSQPLAVGELPADTKEQLKRRELLRKALNEIPAMPPEQFRAEIERISREYAESAPPPPEYAELVDKEFSEALKAAELRISEMESRQHAIEKLAEDMKKLLDAGDLLVKADLEKFDAECIKLLGAVPELSLIHI